MQQKSPDKRLIRVPFETIVAPFLPNERES